MTTDKKTKKDKDPLHIYTRPTGKQECNLSNPAENDTEFSLPVIDDKFLLC